ncbi:MAG: hypothetical protein ACRDD8_06895, partial [Bacteroidales bacterium]
QCQDPLYILTTKHFFCVLSATSATISRNPLWIGIFAVADGCRWLQMKFDLQRVITYNIVVYIGVADVADKTSNFVSSKLLCENLKHRPTFWYPVVRNNLILKATNRIYFIR